MNDQLPTDNFTYECTDCTRTVKVRNGVDRWHFCPVLPWLRGRVDEAWCKGYDHARNAHTVRVKIKADTSEFERLLDEAEASMAEFKRMHDGGPNRAGMTGDNDG